MAIDNHNFFELELLKHVEKNRNLTNRMVARKLGISVRLAHDILKRMVGKGLLHVKVVHSRRWDYFLTPQGLLEKARLTVEFFDFSMYFYREARKRSAQVCRDLSENGIKKVGFLGTGDLAEITYLGVQEWNLDLNSIYDDTKRNETFLNIPVQATNEISRTLNEAIIVCMYEKTNPMTPNFLPGDVEDNGQFHWVF